MGEQTNNRAELRGVIKTLELEPRPINIRTDSQYVFDGALRHRFKWKRSAWKGRRRLIANSDLWIILDSLLEARPAGDVLLTKVKAHATTDDVLQGVITQFDFPGNTAADALAVAGACQNFENKRSTDDSRRRFAIAFSVQKMMVDILCARGCAERHWTQSGRK